MRAANAKINGEWGRHVGVHTKNQTDKLRRRIGRRESVIENDTAAAREAFFKARVGPAWFRSPER